MSGVPSGVPSMGYSPDHLIVMEKELASLKSQLEVSLDQHFSPFVLGVAYVCFHPFEICSKNHN